MEKVIVLTSVDDDHYLHVVVPPANKSFTEAQQEIATVVDEVKSAYPDEWNWDDLQSRLNTLGYAFPDYCIGPCWDE